MKKNCRTKEQMYPLIEGFASSGLTVKAYAKSIGIKFYTYKYWLRKYRLEQQVEESEASSPTFIPLQINTTHPQEEHNLNIVYPNGVQINLVNSLDTSGIVTLKKLILCLD